MKLEFVPKNLSRKDTVVVVRELKAIESEQGLITPRAMVERAKPKDSPLHSFFEWNDKAAADKYRLVQARQLIACVLVRNGESENAENVRAFVNVKMEQEGDDEEPLQGYVSAQTMLDSPSLQEQVLQYAKSQLIGWRLRFGHLRQFLGIVQEIDKTIPAKPNKKAA